MRVSWCGLVALAIVAVPTISHAAERPAHVHHDANDRCSAARSPKAHDVDDDCVTATAVVGVDGGTIAAPSGLSIDIPFGALDAPTTISVSVSTAPAPAGVGAVSPVYQFEPEGLLFAKPVTVTLPLPAGVSAGSVYWSELGSTTVFDAIGGTISGNTIVAQTGHFSLAVIGAASSTRTVSGIGSVTYISASTRVSQPIDFAAQSIEAIVLDSNGAYARIGGLGSNGTFRIDGVPTGNYILHAGDVYLVTSSNVPDLGYAAGGRPLDQRIPLTSSAFLDLTVNGMEPWQPGDWLEFYSSEADDWDFGTDRYASPPLVGGETSVDLPMDASTFDAAQNYAIQGSLGDRALVAHLSGATSANGFPYIAMSGAVQLPAFDLTTGGSLAMSASLVDMTRSNPTAFDYRGTAFASALHADGNPNLVYCGYCGGFAGVLAQGGDANDGFYTSNADLLLLNDTNTNGTDMNTGTMYYGTPTAASLTGQWGIFFYVRYALLAQPVLPGALPGRPFLNYLDWSTTMAVGSAVPITPPVTAPRNIAVNGVPFFSGGTGVGTTPTLSWSVPSTGTPAFYTIGVYELGTNANNRTTAASVATIETSDTSFALPGGILQPGSPYVFTLTATASTSTSGATALAAEPFKTALDIAHGTVSSEIFWP